jgi:hypothetical protein
MGGRRRVGFGVDRNERKHERLSCSVRSEGEAQRRGGEREADGACGADSRENARDGRAGDERKADPREWRKNGRSFSLTLILFRSRDLY